MMGEHFRWAAWEELIRQHGLTIDRPRLSVHPVWRDIIYPMDYGYINDTASTDREGVDVFVGTKPLGLVGLIMTHDYRRGDREVKLLFNCAPCEIYLAHGFINCDRVHMEGTLVLRQAMPALWQKLGCNSQPCELRNAK